MKKKFCNFFPVIVICLHANFFVNFLRFKLSELFFHFGPQNNSSSTWNHPSLRTQSSVTDSAFYSLLGHNQQHAGHRQGQQSSQHYGSLGYSNFYGSPTGITHGHQQQSLSDLNSGGSEDLSAQQLHQFWQQSY